MDNSNLTLKHMMDMLESRQNITLKTVSTEIRLILIAPDTYKLEIIKKDGR